MAASPLPHSLRMLAIGLVWAASLGMSCEQSHEPPALPAPVLNDIHLRIADPERGLPGIFLAWDYPGAKASYFEIYRSLARDSLRAGTLAPAAVTESLSAALDLPDQVRPLTVYFAVRAIRIEPTGQKIVSDTLVPDSLTVAPSLTILKPASGSHQGGRILDLAVQTQATFGATLRMAYFEKAGGAGGVGGSWIQKKDTCLPMDGCGQSVFGGSLQSETLVLDPHDGSDTLTALFCAFGIESFQGHPTGLTESVACSRFFRINP